MRDKAAIGPQFFEPLPTDELAGGRSDDAAPVGHAGAAVWLIGDDALSPAAREAIADPGNDIFVSAVSAMEIATKHRIGRMPEAAFLTADAAGIIANRGSASCRCRSARQVAGSLPALHPDRSTGFWRRRRSSPIWRSCRTTRSSTPTVSRGCGRRGSISAEPAGDIGIERPQGLGLGAFGRPDASARSTPSRRDAPTAGRRRIHRGTAPP